MDDDRSATDLVAAARAKTVAAGSARITLLTEVTWEMPSQPRRHRGGLMRPVTAVAKAAAKGVLKAATRSIDFRHLSAEGVIDFQRRRYMLDYGSYARLYAEGKAWDGRSGRLLSTLPPDEVKLQAPLWLLDLLVGVTSATDERSVEVRDTRCHCFAATVDLGRASKVTPGGIAVPPRGRFEELRALPLDVCVDGEHVRRVRFRFEDRTETLELWDFGVSLDDLDWTRLPMLHEPDEAAS